jgi:hypothetical protein
MGAIRARRVGRDEGAADTSDERKSVQAGCRITKGRLYSPQQKRWPPSHWLEWVDSAEAILDEPLKIVDGYAVAPDRPGNGLTWNATAVARYRM